MPSASALVYLFGDFFTPKAFIEGVQLPWRNARVSEENLAVTMFLAEFISLMQENQISLQLLAPGKFPCCNLHTTLAQSAPVAGGLGRHILSSASTVNGGNSHQEDVRDIVWRVIGNDCLSPWTIIEEVALAELVREGYFIAEEHHGLSEILGTRYHPSVEKITAVESEARQLKQRLDSFRERDPLFYSALWDHICQGLYSRQICSDL